MSTKKTAAPSAAQVNKLFAEVRALETNVEKFHGHYEQTVVNVAEQLNKIRAALPCGGGLPDNTLGSLLARVARLECQREVGITPKSDPKNYVLTDADWQRVIKEKWLCEFSGNCVEWSTPLVSTLFRICPHDTHKFVPTYYSGGNASRLCRPLNKPGVMQPYFGQGMPVDGGVKVVVLLKDGRFNSPAPATFWNWVPATNQLHKDCDVVAYMEVPAV